ncbi:MAG: OmpH family outer membrane protein [Bacteroidales bacterium]|nr:OmpH family outer membrane protein [Bacteroidales bacterium]
MKHTPLILSIVAVVISLAALLILLFGGNKTSVATAETHTEAVAGDIVFIQLDSLIVNYDMYNDLMSALQSKYQTIQEDLEKKGRKWESDYKSFENQVNKGLLTRSNAEQQQNSLLQRQEALQNEMNAKQQELAEEEYVLNNRVMDAIQTFVSAYNAEHGYSMILTTNASTSVVLNAQPGLDITAAVLAGLNEEYIKTRSK